MSRYSECLILLCLSCFSGCSRVNHDYRSAEMLRHKEFISGYFKEVHANSFVPPQDDFFNEAVSRDSLESQKRKIWECWKETCENDFVTKAFSCDTTVFLSIPSSMIMPVKMFPKGDMPPGGYPLIIGLHGGGAYDVPDAHSAPVNTISWESMSAIFRSEGPSGVFYVIPRMADDRIGSWSKFPQREAIRQICRSAVLSGKINRDKIYLYGVSQGGYGVIKLAAFMPDYFAAVAVVSAADEPSENVVNLRNLSFRMDVGRYDSDFSRNYYAEMWKDSLTATAHAAAPGEFDFQVNIIPDKAHELNGDGVAGWLLSRGKRLLPSRISYVYELCEDGFPKGTYNLNFTGIDIENGDKIIFDEIIDENKIILNTDKRTVSGNNVLRIYIPEMMMKYDVIRVILDGKEIISRPVYPNLGAMMESVALFGDRPCIFVDKVDVTI